MVDYPVLLKDTTISTKERMNLVAHNHSSMSSCCGISEQTEGPLQKAECPHLKQLKHFLTLINGLTLNLTFQIEINSGRRLDRNSILTEEESLSSLFLLLSLNFSLVIDLISTGLSKNLIPL